MNEKFFSISKEKQERIIRCAYEVFSQNSYKEASMSKIADAGGISKSLLFHYFSNKREFHLYLWENAGRQFCEIQTRHYTGATGFFEIIQQRFMARFTFMREQPVIFLFVLRAFFEEDPELNDPVRSHVRKLCDKKTEEIMALAETSGFRPGVDVKFLIQEIEGFFLITLWQIFSQGKWDVNYLEKNFTKRIEQWKAVYLKEN